MADKPKAVDKPASIPALIQRADKEERVVVVDCDGYAKYPSGKAKPGVILVATGARAVRLRQYLREILEDD